MKGLFIFYIFLCVIRNICYVSTRRGFFDFVKECKECENNNFMIRVKAIDGLILDVVEAGGFGGGMLCRQWSKISLLNMETRGVRGFPHFSRHSPSKSCHRNFLILHKHDFRWCE